MDELGPRTMLGFGRAYRMLEALVQADLRETTRKMMATTFGASSEYRLIATLAKATEPLHLSEIAVRAGATRRAISPEGELRQTLMRMERVGMVINVGLADRPLYQMNLLNDESRLLMSIFENEPA